MNRPKRRSDRAGRAPLSSPGRPPIAGREERGRFWTAIAAGLSSEDAAATVSVPQAVGSRWFRKAGGMPPAMFGPSAKPLSGRYLSFAEREEIALLRAGGCSMQGGASDRAGGFDHLPGAEAQRGHPKRRPGVSRDDGAVARRAISPSAEAGEACAQPRLAGLCAGTLGWHGHRSRWRSGSRPNRIVEGSSAWTAAGPTMGARLEP